jgi:DUF4097 and DUF4098 domain-containing protein YvlB
MRVRYWIGAAAIVAVASGSAAAQAQSAATQATGDQVTVPFSDPGRIGTVSVKVVSGSIRVHGTDRRDVSVSIAASERRQRNRRTPEEANGLTRLTSPSGLIVEEENNAMTVRTSSMNGGPEIALEVPARVNLKLSTVNGGEIVVDGVQGELEANNVNGSITLNNVAGSVVAHSTNGKVLATVRQVAADTPMSFTSLNGNVDVTLPASLKANLKLRTDNGDIFTDFDIALRNNTSPTVVSGRQNNGRYRVELDKSLYGSVNGGGPEFELRTFNGNVYLRKAGQ